MADIETCKLCGRVFDAREDLDDHSRTAHGSAGAIALGAPSATRGPREEPGEDR